MRRKQLLGIFLPLILLSTTAAMAANLTGLNVATQGNVTTFTIKANGAFSHTEYRPSESSLLVDLTGISAGALDGKSERLQAPGVTSYRVLEFRAASGVEVARVEFTLAEAPEVRFQEVRGGLQVRMTVGSTTPPLPETAASAPDPPGIPATTQSEPEILKPVEARATQVFSPGGHPVTVRNLIVTNAPEGLELEIEANGPLTPQAMKVDNPERLVIDLPGSLPVRARKIDVNTADVKSVRMSRFQETPPTTRVVVDLLQARDYQVLSQGNLVLVKLRAPSAELAGQPEMPSSPVGAQPAMEALAAAEPAKAELTPEVQQPAKVEPTAVSAAKPAETPTYAMAATPAPQPVQMASVMPMSTPAPQPVVSTPVAPVKTVEPVKVAAAVPPPPASMLPQGNQAQKFVMVEPKFHPKQEQAAPISAGRQPTVRAADAASKFASNSAPVALAALTSPGTGGVQPMAAMQQPAKPVPPATAAGSAPSQAPAPTRGRYTGEPISVNLKDVDLKDFFRLVHEISGLNIVLDPNVRGSLTLVLDDVPWDQALDIVLKNNGLDRELDGNVLRIATIDTLKREADARRAQIEAKALAEPKVTVTRFLSYAHSKDVVPTLKKFLTQRGEVLSDDRTNALIIQDIPGVFPEIDRLLQQLDRKTPEVEIEARVIAATRNFARDLGTQIGFAWGGTTTAVGGAGSVGQSPISVTQPDGAPAPPYILDPTGTRIPLFTNMPAIGPTGGLSLLNMGANYRLDVILTAAETRGLLKILSRPRIVTQNNIQAVIRQGFKIPVVTKAQLGGPDTTTYIDAFLRLTVTPQITAENTIFLNVDVENTTPDFGRTIGGNPTLITQQALTQVLVSDGGTVVIGGVIQTENSANVQQVPWLGSIPVLGNLFKRRAVSTSTRELFFFITPRIVQT